ncbi:MAG: hypothetical protein IKE55_04845 [Kiritimatiellae bacterium]|nr:hypothetical protein [Kiritimatiellia bacterium]
MKKLLMVCAAAIAVTCQAGIKYWDNPEYKAYDVGDYVQGDLIWNYDGIRNVGADQPHSANALAWANLGSFGSANDVVLQRAAGSAWTGISAAELETGTYGEWTDNGFVFRGNSRFRRDSPGKINVGTSYTLQFLVDATSSEQVKSLGFLLAVQYELFALCVSKSDGKFYWRTAMAYNSSKNYSFMDGGAFDYGTAIVDGTANTTAFFSGTKAPTSGNGFRQYDSVAGRDEKGYTIGCTSGAGNEFTGTMKFLRVYDHALTEEELAWNRVVDEACYFGRQAPLPVTNVVVATAVAGANGTEPAGCYAVAGRHVFTAPATVNVGGIDYVCTGYTVETRNGDGWSAPVFHKVALYQPSACLATDEGCIRITWQWAKAAGLANLYSADDYVWDGLVLFYDGICNVGTNLPHSTTATTWKNLGSAGAVNDMFFQRLNAAGNSWVAAADFSVVDDRDPGAWTENGFAFKGDSRFRVVSTDGNAGSIDTGTDYSLQMLLDAKAADQTTTYAFPFSLSANKFSFVLYKSGSIAWRNDNDGYQVGGNNPQILYGASFDYITAIVNGTDNTAAFFFGAEIPTSGSGFRQYDSITAHGFERGYDLGGYGNSSYDYLLVGTIRSFRQYSRSLAAAEVVQNRKVDNWRYFGIPDVTNVVVQSTVPCLRGEEPDGPYAVDGSHTFAAPATITYKGIDYACDGYMVETWDGSTWGNAQSGSTASYAYSTSAGKVRLTWKWKPVRGIRTAADYSYDDYSQAGLVWHYDGLLNQGVGKDRSTAVDAKWINLGSAGATYDMVKYLVGSKVDGEWTDDGYLFRGGTRFRVVGKPIGPFKSFSIQALVDADIADQTSRNGCYIMSGIWDYFSMFFINGTAANAASLCCYFQGQGTGTSSETAVYFKNDSGRYDYATAIMDYDAKTAQVFGGVEAPASGTGFHQFDSVISRSDSGFGLGNSGGDGTDGLVGTLKFFRYYDRVLTGEEIVRNRNVDAVRYFGELGVTNVLVRTKYGAVGSEAEVLAEAPGAYKVEGSWTFSATSVKDKNGALCPVAGFYTEELVDGDWLNKAWHGGQASYTYDEATASGKTIRLTWSGPPCGMSLIVK